MKTRASDHVFNWIIYIITGIFSLMCIYPIYYVFIYSISDPMQAMTGVTFYPKGFSLEGYKAVFQLDAIASSAVISVARTLIGTVGTVLCCALFAYILHQPDLPFRKFISKMMVITMYVGGGLIPTFLVMKSLGLNNTFWVYIIPGLVGAYNVILIRTFMESTPASLEESAKIDGAGYLTIFFKIIIPISVPILATIAIFSAVGQWNSWFDCMLYISDSDLYPLQYVLYQYLNEAETLTKQLQQGGNLNAIQQQTQLTPMSIKMAITMVVIIPILLVYPFMQRFFVKGIMVGAIKG